MSYVKNEQRVKKRNIRPKKQEFHSTVAVIIRHDYYKGKIETKARFLGMRPKGLLPSSL